jgi:hypothetical protein
VTVARVKTDRFAMTPQSILSYFEQLSVEHANNDTWAEGAEATREWIELMETDRASQERVDALLGRIRDNESMMFIELRLQVERWADGAGWRVG